MFKAATLTVAALCVAAGRADPSVEELEASYTMRRQIIDHVNSAETTWTAGLNPSTLRRTYRQIARMCGVKPGGPKLPEREPLYINAAIPDSYDVREVYGKICPNVNEVRDQADCGSCWAFGAAEAASDRLCISTNGSFTAPLSAEDLLSCCTDCGQGCNGGYPSAANQYIASTGIVTGGLYNDFSYCRSYTLKPCEHHVTGKYQKCTEPTKPTPSCQRQCDSQSTYGVTYEKDERVAAKSYSVPSQVSELQKEIMTYGTVEVAMTVYADFEAYTGGIYKHTTGSYLGGHALSMVGWGEENGTPYWIVRNSWRKDWGENGYFRIVRGQDECGIESQAVAVQF